MILFGDIVEVNLKIVEPKRGQPDDQPGPTAGISEIAIDVPEIKNIIADIGYGEVGPHMHHTNYGCITVTLKPRSFRKRERSQEEVVKLLEKRFEGILGVSVGFSQPIAHEVDGLIAGSGAQVVMKVFGDDMEKLKSIAGEIDLPPSQRVLQQRKPL